MSMNVFISAEYPVRNLKEWVRRMKSLGGTVKVEVV